FSPFVRRDRSKLRGKLSDASRLRGRCCEQWVKTDIIKTQSTNQAVQSENFQKNNLHNNCECASILTPQIQCSNQASKGMERPRAPEGFKGASSPLAQKLSKSLKTSPLSCNCQQNRLHIFVQNQRKFAVFAKSREIYVTFYPFRLLLIIEVAMPFMRKICLFCKTVDFAR
ncbi:MAG: hypothetical protein ACI4KR_03240, partial [Ruminiclostridium sp.]